MSDTEQRLRRQLRAMGAMNRQLQAQLEGGGARAWGVPSGQSDGDLLATAALSGSLTAPGGARRAATASTWLDQLSAGMEGAHAFLVRRKSGSTYLVEGGYRREVRSGLLAAALEQKLGRARVVGDGEFARWTDGVPVEVLEGPDGPPFVVVGGRRLPLRGMPLPYPVGREHLDRFPEGPSINVASALVSRATLRDAMYGRYQADRLRAAIARRGVSGTAREAARRATRKARSAFGRGC